VSPVLKGLWAQKKPFPHDGERPICFEKYFHDQFLFQSRRINLKGINSLLSYNEAMELSRLKKSKILLFENK